MDKIDIIKKILSWYLGLNTKQLILIKIFLYITPYLYRMMKKDIKQREEDDFIVLEVS
jgi:hypothetical protein